MTDQIVETKEVAEECLLEFGEEILRGVIEDLTGTIDPGVDYMFWNKHLQKELEEVGLQVEYGKTTSEDVREALRMALWLKLQKNLRAQDYFDNLGDL